MITKLIFYSILNISFLYGLSFNQITNYTLNNSEELQIAKFDILIENEELNIISSEYYPQVSFVVNLEDSNSLSDSVTSTYIDNSSVSNSNTKQSYSKLSMNYDLYSFGRTDIKRELQEYNKESLVYAYCKKSNELTEKLLEYYYQSLTYQNKNRLLKEILEKKNEIYNSNKRLFELGDIDNITLISSSIEIANLYSEISNNDKLLFESLTQLSVISKYKISKGIQLESLKYNFTDNEKINFKNTHESKSLEYQMKSKKKQIKLIEKDYLPTISLYSKYDIYGSDENSFSTSLENMESNSFKVGVSLSWNLFNGFKTTSSRRKAILELKQMNYKYNLARDDFNMQLEVNSNNNISEKAILEQKMKNLEFSTANEKSSNRLSNIGEISKLEKLNLSILKKYKEIDYIEEKEKVGYELTKKAILLGKGSECIVR